MGTVAWIGPLDRYVRAFGENRDAPPGPPPDPPPAPPEPPGVKEVCRAEAKAAERTWALHKAGFMSVDDVRAAEGLPPVRPPRVEPLRIKSLSCDQGGQVEVTMVWGPAPIKTQVDGLTPHFRLGSSGRCFCGDSNCAYGKVVPTAKVPQAIPWWSYLVMLFVLAADVVTFYAFLQLLKP
jgi:hypothetical protein